MELINVSDNQLFMMNYQKMRKFSTYDYLRALSTYFKYVHTDNPALLSEEKSGKVILLTYKYVKVLNQLNPNNQIIFKKDPVYDDMRFIIQDTFNPDELVLPKIEEHFKDDIIIEDYQIVGYMTAKCMREFFEDSDVYESYGWRHGFIENMNDRILEEYEVVNLY